MNKDNFANVCVSAVAFAALAVYAWGWKKEVERYKGIREEHEKYIEYMETEIERSETECEAAKLSYETTKLAYQELKKEVNKETNSGLDLNITC